MQIKPVQAGDGIRELIPGNDAGIVVYALSPGERSLDLEAVVEPLHNPRLESMVGGTGRPVQITDIAGVVVWLRRRAALVWVTTIRIGLSTAICRIPKVSEDVDLREEVASGSQLWHNEIGVVDTERLMNPMRSNVTNRRGEVAKEFPLDVEIPLHHIIALRMGLQRPVLRIVFDFFVVGVCDDVEGPRRKGAGRQAAGGN